MGVLKMRVNELYRLPVFLGPQTQPPRPQRAPSRWGHFFLGRLPTRPRYAFVSDFEQGDIGPDLFRAACNMGLEGLVSKRRDRPYRAGRCPDWVKVKNRSHPSINRVKEAFS